MTVLEAGLRGAAMALLLLLAIVGWRDARHAAVARYGREPQGCVIDTPKTAERHAYLPVLRASVLGEGGKKLRGDGSGSTNLSGRLVATIQLLKESIPARQGCRQDHSPG